MKTFIAILILVLSLFPVFAQAAAATEDAAIVTVRIDGSGHDTVNLSIELNPGQSFRVELTSASGTGYLWQLVQEPNLVSIADHTDPAPATTGKPIPGTLQTEAYLFQAGSEPGTETMQILLARPWEEQDMAVKTVNLTVTIQ